MASKVRALIVEDTLELREFLMTLLDEEGYVPVAAPGPTGARRILARQPIDVVITDLVGTQPGDPIESARAWLREATRFAPILVVTGCAWAVESTASELGVAGLLLKPFELDEFLACLQAIATRTTAFASATADAA